jgi:hypothetical protein
LDLGGPDRCGEAVHPLAEHGQQQQSAEQADVVWNQQPAHDEDRAPKRASHASLV